MSQECQIYRSKVIGWKVIVRTPTQRTDYITRTKVIVSFLLVLIFCLFICSFMYIATLFGE